MGNPAISLITSFSITANKFWTSPHTKATYPAGWTLTLPEGVLNIIPDFPDQELYNLRSISGSYWEGSVSITGKFQGKKVAGKGYVELVGYQKTSHHPITTARRRANRRPAG